MLRGPFTDRGLAHLRGLDGLFALNVDDARAADHRRRASPRCASCRISARLSVEATDAWMPGIAAMPHLRFLGIQDTPASDDGWVQLAARDDRVDLGTALSRPAATRLPRAVADAARCAACR